MFSWDFAKKIFDGFTILRWTDFIRPVEFVQIEKSANQAILSYIIGKEYEERSGNDLNWEYIIESNIYGLLCKIATSDIKSTIGNKIKKDHLDEVKNYIVNYYFDNTGTSKYNFVGVLDYSVNLLEKDKLEKYILESNSKEGSKSNPIEFQICYLAHKFATYREFLYISFFNPLSPDKERVNNDIGTTNIKTKLDNVIIQGILEDLEISNSNLTLFYSYFEKLKPQVRWAQTCRIPQTTVLGHSMYVALLTYFAIKELNLKKDAHLVLVDSFFAALFHDLPESLTRDIISPVKRNIENLEKELASYEYNEVIEKICSKIEGKQWKNDFLELLGKENDKFVPFNDRKYVLGKLIEAIDKTAAFMEAKMSVQLGVNSDEIQKGIKNTTIKLSNLTFNYKNDGDWRKSLNVLNFNDFLASIPQYNEGV